MSGNEFANFLRFPTRVCQINKGGVGGGGKFLKKLWCCVGGSITR